jgi:catechol 2,3-dioxygenase-like lactoylglutathione lyase family enzyme
MSSTTTTTLSTTKLGRVCVSVADSERALAFYGGTLGLEKVVDMPMGPDMRWIEVRFPGAETTIALAPPPPGQEAGGQQTGIGLDTTDVEADHAALQAAGVDVDAEISRMGGEVPPMFWMRDPDGNSIIVVQAQ